MKILVVEDDRAVAQALQHLLASCHYAIDIAVDGEEGWEMASHFDYDFVLLDVRLPGIDGVTLCQRLRRQNLQMPILLLTGQGGAHQKAIALNAGADDYVVKPFDAEELIARVQALLRRGGPRTQPILTWGDLSVDPSSCRVSYGTQPVAATPKEYAILELLLRNPQKTFSTAAILNQAWSSLESPGEESVRGHIKELRKKLREAGAPSEFIKTVYRVGYQLNPAYALETSSPKDENLTAAQIADIRTANSELQSIVTSLQEHQVELQEKNQTLANANQRLTQDLSRLKSLGSQRAGATVAKGEHRPFPAGAIVRDLVRVSVDDSLRAAVMAMDQVRSGAKATSDGNPTGLHQRIRSACAVVIDHGGVVGLLTADMALQGMAQAPSLEEVVVSQLVHQPAATVREADLTGYVEAMNLLKVHQVRYLLVSDPQNHPIGVVTYESLWHSA